MRQTTNKERPQSIQNAGAERPDSVVLAGQRGIDLDPFALLLEQAGLKNKGILDSQTRYSPQQITLSICENSQLAHRHLQERPETHLLLLFRNPAKLIAKALRKNDDPVAAIAMWQKSADEILAIYRQSRRRITLLDNDAACSEPDKTIDALKKRWGLSLQNRSSASHSESAPQHDLVYLIIADGMLEKDLGARNTLNELQASALPLDKSIFPSHENISAALQKFHETTAKLAERKSEINQLKQQITGLKEENNLVLAQLHQVQEELESYVLENRDIQKQAKIAGKKNQTAESDKKKLRRKAEKAENMLAAVHDSWSWKVTAPLRATLGIFVRK